MKNQSELLGILKELVNACGSLEQAIICTSHTKATRFQKKAKKTILKYLRKLQHIKEVIQCQM